MPSASFRYKRKEKNCSGDEVVLLLWVEELQGKKEKEKNEKGKNEMLSDVGGAGSECSGRPIFIFLITENFAPWPDIMLSQTLIYYWQESFLLPLVLDSEAIL